MRCNQYRWHADGGWCPPLPEAHPTDWLLAFSDRAGLAHWDARWLELQAAFPGAELMGCTTAGEIQDVRVYDGDIVVTSVAFDRTRIHVARLGVEAVSAASGGKIDLQDHLPFDGLRHLLVLSDGLNVNGSLLAHGLAAALPASVSVTGGLAGDGDAFAETWVVHNGELLTNHVVCVGFYGDALQVGFGSLGGWDPFGPEREVTRSEGNILYELDGQSALELYRHYLGEYAADLPASGLLFPLSIRVDDHSPELVRTLLGIDEEKGGLIFAGDLPVGSQASLMKANFDRLIDGANSAAEESQERLGDFKAELVVLISCIGRRLVLQQRVEEELDEVRSVVGPEAAVTGFYSYGEICPTHSTTRCELHNQTMTITALSESPV